MIIQRQTPKNRVIPVSLKMMRFFQGEVKRIHQSVRQGGLGAECNGLWPKSPGLTFWPESVTCQPRALPNAFQLHNRERTTLQK